MTLNRYQKTAIATIFVTIALITVGGLVRVAGAGLGCPDWPRCFGRWIPPVSASQLPAGYDHSLFNPFLTWTEYVNRLFGILTGFMILFTAVFSISYRKKKPSVFFSSLATLVLVAFQGWLGGQVVESSLAGWLVTVHMIVALAILALLIVAIFNASSGNIEIELPAGANRRVLFWIGVGLLFLTLVQIGLGAQVRESIDSIRGQLPRSEWLAHSGSLNDYHQGFAWIVFIAGMYLVYKLREYPAGNLLKRTVVLLISLLFFQMILGMALVYFELLPAIQILHLTNVALLFCVEFIFVLLTIRSKSVSQELIS